MRLIGLTGRAGSGKSTVAKILEERHWVETSLANPMKHFLQEVFLFSVDQLWGPSEKRNEGDKRYRRKDGSFLTPRHALQTLGTEWGRACYEDIWVDAALREVVYLEGLEKWRGVVISDVRFDNEAAAIRKAGGLLWHIIRPDAGPSTFSSTHESEKGITFDGTETTIVNDGSLAFLEKVVLALEESLK